MFCNQFGQTAETANFELDEARADGTLVISKGSQEGTTFGKDNGRCCASPPTAKRRNSCGLRQPFVGIKTGSSAGQQGNYVPSTPIHHRDNQFYDLPTIAPPGSIRRPSPGVV